MLWELSTIEWVVSFGFICCLTYICGWLSDSLLGWSAFGHIGNWLLILIGAYTSMYVFNIYGYRFEYELLFTLAYISSGATAFFLCMCIIKYIFVR